MAHKGYTCVKKASPVAVDILQSRMEETIELVRSILRTVAELGRERLPSFHGNRSDASVS